jgi:CRAL/TRIO, N-terminal domain
LSDEEEKQFKLLTEKLVTANIHLPPEMLYAGDLEATLIRFLKARKYKHEDAITQLTGVCRV